MAKTKISEFSSTAGNNTDIDSINIAEGCAPSGINNAIRELMAQLKDFQAGTAGDSFNGPIGTTTANTGAFTTLAASGAVTISGGTANGVAYLNGSKVLTTGSALTFDGTNLSFADSAKAIFGAGSDLQIYHDGSASYIAETGTGPLNIQMESTSTALGSGSALINFLAKTGASLHTAANLSIHQPATTEGVGDFRFSVGDGAGVLTEALRVNSTGIDVTGTVVADGLTVEGASAGTFTAATFRNTTGANGTRVQAVLQNVGIACDVNLVSERVGANSGADFIVETSDGSTGLDLQRLRISEIGDISFYEDTGTTPKFFWDASAESLGIGTSSPAAKLNLYDANNAVYFQQTRGSVVQLSGPTGAAETSPGQIGTSSNSPFRIITNNAERMSITSAGDVGIGTSSPTNKLSVTGNANITGNTTLGDASTDTVTVNGYMGVGGAASGATAINIASSSLTNTTQRGVLSNVTYNSSATNLGVGFQSSPITQAASFTLTNLVGFYSANASKGAGSTITNLHGLYIADQTQGTNNYGITSLVSSGTDKWNIYASGTAANYFAGNVGIGTSSPAEPLHVQEGSSGIVQRAGTVALIEGSANTKLTVASGATSTGEVIFGRNGDNDAGSVRYDHNTNSMQIDTNSTERLRITSAGDVGIGTSSPATKLHVVNGSLTVGPVSDIGTQLLDVVSSIPAAQLRGYIATATSAAGGANGDLLIAPRTSAATSIRFITGTSPTERARIDASGNLIQTVNTTAATLATNNTLTFSIVDNSTLRISVRGSDGTTRTATVALT